MVKGMSSAAGVGHFSESGEEDGDGGRQKSQSGERSHTLPAQLSGELEDKVPGDCRLDPGDSLSALALMFSSGSSLDGNSP